MVDRRKVLRHHPDKKAAVSGTSDDAFFKCIQKGKPHLLITTHMKDVP